MAEIVGAFALPHTPFFPALVRAGGEAGQELARKYERVAAAFREVEPEVIVFFLPDHLADNFQTIPIFDIGAAPSASGPCDDTEHPGHEVTIAVDRAIALHRHLVADGFDVALAREPRLDHASIVPLEFLTPAFQIPIVPIRISTFVRPLPTAQRCRDVGRSVRGGLEAGSPARVAVLATGNFSLEIGGPRMSETHYTGIPDPSWVERIVELMEAGELDQLVAEATPERLERAGAEAGELLLWIAMLASFDFCPPAFVELQPQFGQAFAAWPLRTGAAV
jgi:hypothetical protein